MSHHDHLPVQDVRQWLPDFLTLPNRLSVKVWNDSQRPWGNVWEAKPTSSVYLPTWDDGVDQIAYAAANPVEAGLVCRPQEWPGAIPWLPGKCAVRRPTFFSKKMPADIVLEFVQPTESTDTPAPWEARVRPAVSKREREAQARVRGARAGAGVFGAPAGAQGRGPCAGEVV